MLQSGLIIKITWSAEFRQMLGFSPEDEFPNILSSWAARLHPDDSEAVFSNVAAHLNDSTGQTPYDVECRIMMKNGIYRYFRCFGATMRDEKGVALQVAGAMEDVTDEKLMQEQVRETEERMQLMLNEPLWP